jgi:mannosyltransferase OCH1-like enzyme
MIGSLIIIYSSLKTGLDLGSNDFLPSEFSLEFEPPTLEQNCPNTMTFLEDIILPQNSSIRIPSQIHIVIRDRCVSHEVKDSFEKWHQAGYSLLFHDDDAANDLLSLHRPTFPQLQSLTKCLNNGTFKTELVKLLLLFDKGGVAIDENKVPGDRKAWGHMIQSDDEGLFLVTADKANTYSTEFMAAVPEHPILYTLIQKTFADLFMQITDENFLPSPEERKSGYFDFILKYVFSNITDTNSIRSRHEGMGRSITMVNISNDQTKYLLKNASFSQPIDELTASPNQTCVNWETPKDDNALSSLSEIVRSDEIQCPVNQIIVQDTITINPQSLNKERKIPKIVHMTSKTRCMPKEFADNIDTWKFKNYSLFLHDDDAVARLFKKDWPEFPLLHDVLNCITSGAGFADLWRYLILWEYGGVYTDLDNAPGPFFKDAEIIEDHMDSFLEVEAARIPSQYFIAASPKHPIMYMAVQNTIQRLFNEQNIVRQYVPYVTGPGAMKWGVHYAIGNAYLSPGTYSTFDKTRSMTIIGNRTSAMRRNFIKRGNVLTRDHYDKMNMTHYHYAGRQKGLPLKSCVEVLYDMNKFGKYPNLLGLYRLSRKT